MSVSVGRTVRVNWASRSSAFVDPLDEQRFVGREALLSDVRARLLSGRGFAIATLNLDHAVKLRRNPEFRAAYEKHTHVTADGNPIVWLERLAGRQASLVTGADLVLPLAQAAADCNAQIAIVGTSEAALEQAATAMRAKMPNLRIALTLSPSRGFDPESDEARMIADRLRKSGARFCFLALGAPKQELLAAQLRSDLPELGIASVGAGIDFIAGAQRRAPEIVRFLAMEWAWRLAQDPRRLATRYVRCAALLPRLGAEAMRSRWHLRGSRQFQL